MGDTCVSSKTSENSEISASISAIGLFCFELNARALGSPWSVNSEQVAGKLWGITPKRRRSCHESSILACRFVATNASTVTDTWLTHISKRTFPGQSSRVPLAVVIGSLPAGSQTMPAACKTELCTMVLVVPVSGIARQVPMHVLNSPGDPACRNLTLTSGTGKFFWGPPSRQNLSPASAARLVAAVSTV